MLQVVAAIIERNGEVLICQRQPWQSHPLKWEFPGGKVEAGESPRQALARELSEEVGIQNATGAEIARYTFRYPGKRPILLIFLRVQSFTGEPQNLVFRQMRWEPSNRLADFDFVEGDRNFLEMFQKARSAP